MGIKPMPRPPEDYVVVKVVKNGTEKIAKG
jgi:hypothetical protein